jgi:predicted metalloprotease with PDZ domain
VKTLNGVVPYDWATFLRQRVYDVHPHVPEDGITRGGYKLAYTDTLPQWVTKAEGAVGVADFSTSLGFSVTIPRSGGDNEEAQNAGPTGSLINVWWNSPAFKAGITPDMHIVSVNGKAFSAQMLRDAIVEAEKTKKPLSLQFRRGDEFTTVTLSYFDGLRVPSLQRVEGTPDRLEEIFAPSKSPLPAM